MTGNIYIVLKPGSSIVSPWTQISNWNGYYLQFANSYSEHGTLGGQSQHGSLSDTEKLSKSNDSVGSSGYGLTWAGGTLAMAPHSGHSIVLNSITTALNNPIYRNCLIAYMDLSQWLSEERRFPEGTLLLTETNLTSWDEVTRDSDYDGKLLKFDASAGTGGVTEHYHTANVSLSQGVPGSSYIQTGGSACGQWNAHTHSAKDFATNTTNSIPVRIRCRVYRATAQTTKAYQGAIVFIDVTPPAEFTAVSWGNKFCMGANEDANSVGTNNNDSHSVSGTSNAYGTGGMSAPDSEEPVYYTPDPHSHSISFTLSGCVFTPLNVKLYPVKLTSTIIHMQTKTAGADFDLISKLVRTETVTLDVLTKKVGSKSYNMDALIKGQKEKSYNMVVRNLNIGDWSFNADLVTKKILTAAYEMGVKINRVSASYEMGLKTIRTAQNKPPLVHTMFSSFIDQLDKFEQDMQAVKWMNDVSNAAGGDLDLFFGQGYDIPRLAGEDDESYRRRIITFYTIHAGSATKATLKTVLDSILQEPGATQVFSGNGTVRVNFATDSAIRTAMRLKVNPDLTLVEYAIREAIAAGFDYKIYFPIVDYRMSVSSKGQDWSQYDMSLWTQRQDNPFEYYMGIRKVLVTQALLMMDLLIMKGHSYDYIMDVVTKMEKDSDFIMDLISKKGYNQDYEADLLTLKDCPANYSMDLMTFKADIILSYAMDLLKKKTRIFDDWNMGLSSVLRGESTLAMDVLLKKASIGVNYQMRMKVATPTNKSYQMSVRIVPGA